MSRIVTKPTKWHVRPTKTQISLGIRPVWSESSLFAWRKLGSLASYPLSAQRGLWSDWPYAQADLRLRWAYSHFVCFVVSWLKYVLKLCNHLIWDTEGVGHFAGRLLVYRHFLVSRFTALPLCVAIFSHKAIEPPRDKTNKMTCAPSEDSDQPFFTVRMKKAWVLCHPLSAQRRLWSDWADAQADLILRWAHMPFCWFCHEAVHLLFSFNCWLTAGIAFLSFRTCCGSLLLLVLAARIYTFVHLLC